jgi:hypothetical protein
MDTLQDEVLSPKGKFVNVIVPMNVSGVVRWNEPLNGKGPSSGAPGIMIFV